MVLSLGFWTQRSGLETQENEFNKFNLIMSQVGSCWPERQKDLTLGVSHPLHKYI